MTTIKIARYDEALALRAQGMSYRMIAKRLGEPLGTVHRWVQLASSEALTDGKEALPVTKVLAQASIDLSTPDLVLAEIDHVYGDMDARGYTRTAALKVRTLHIKLEALRRIEPPPCASHITVEVAYRRVQQLVETVMQELRSTVGRAALENRDATTEAVEALFERVKDRFNGQLKIFRQEDARNGGNLVA